MDDLWFMNSKEKRSIYSNLVLILRQEKIMNTSKKIIEKRIKSYNDDEIFLQYLFSMINWIRMKMFSKFISLSSSSGGSLWLNMKTKFVFVKKFDNLAISTKQVLFGYTDHSSTSLTVMKVIEIKSIRENNFAIRTSESKSQYQIIFKDSLF